MRRHSALILALLLATGTSHAQPLLNGGTAASDHLSESQPPAPADAQRIRPAPAFSAGDLTALPTASWITNGGNLFNQRYSPLAEITPANVASLKAVWRTRLNSGHALKYSGEAQPLIYQGVIYIVTGADDVFAVDARTGRTLWAYAARLDPSNGAVCCGWTSRGLGMGEGKIYVGQLDGRIVALDQATGRVLWATQIGRWQDGITITSAPLYYDGMVITGTAGGDKGVRGVVVALDAASGRERWRFYTIPAPGEFGHETWPQNSDVWRRGGAAVWQTPAVDPDLGMIYFSTANAAPDFNGALRPGDNLFASSIVALDVKTGQYRWHYQQVHHDLWDYDAPNPIVLFDVPVDGRMRKALAQAGKTGWVYILDRADGKPLLGIDEKPVPQEPRQRTAATQPYPRGDAFVPQSLDEPVDGLPLVNGGRIFTPYWNDPVAAKPATAGGANWPPSSYDPSTHLFFVCAQDRAQLFNGGMDGDLGGKFTPAQKQAEMRGIFAALDMKTNRLVWSQKWRDPCYSGSAATAGGVVFVGRNDGHLVAYNSRSGQELWQFQTGAGVNAPPSVFEMDGRQYVAVLSAGNLFGLSPRGDSLWLFSLDGTMGPVPARR